MAIKKTVPYIIFNGTAAAAIEFYQVALGAQIAVSTRFGESPAGANVPEHKDLILHAHLLLGAGEVMISDTTPDRYVPGPGNIQIHLEYADLAAMEAAFQAMSEDATIWMPMHDAFWGTRFGMLTDKFSVSWMFSYWYPKTA